MADWCVATGQPPAVYLSLTLTERNAFIAAVDAAQR